MLFHENIEKRNNKFFIISSSPGKTRKKQVHCRFANLKIICNLEKRINKAIK
jgi:hypothetical protein